MWCILTKFKKYMSLNSLGGGGGLRRNFSFPGERFVYDKKSACTVERLSYPTVTLSSCYLLFSDKRGPADRVSAVQVVMN
jgi:hypothetical protein